MDEQQWATTLKKAQQQTKKRGLVSIDKENARLVEKMNYYKQQLVKTAEEKNFDETKKIFEKLIELRAQQVALTLEELEEKTGKPKDTVVAEHFKAYQKSCLELAVAVDKLLGIDHKL